MEEGWKRGVLHEAGEAGSMARRIADCGEILGDSLFFSLTLANFAVMDASL